MVKKKEKRKSMTKQEFLMLALKIYELTAFLDCKQCEKLKKIIETLRDIDTESPSSPFTISIKDLMKQPIWLDQRWNT